MSPHRGERGFSLLEVMVASAILAAVMAFVASLVLTTANINRKAAVRVAQADMARLALNEVVGRVRLAGNGAPGGINVVTNGVIQRLSAISGIDGTTGEGGEHTPVDNGTDDLWLVVPSRDQLGHACPQGGSAIGSAVPLLRVPDVSGPLEVLCDTFFNEGDLLLVSNMQTAALLSRTVKLGAAPPAVAFAEQETSGFGNLDDKSKRFTAGDTVYPVRLLHYYVRDNVNHRAGPALVRSVGKIDGAEPGGAYPEGPYPRQGRPFIDGEGYEEVVADNIEDFQVAYGFDLTGNGGFDYTTGTDSLDWTNKDGLSPAYAGDGPVRTEGAATLRAVRLTVVVRGDRKAITASGSELLSLDQAPLAKVENHEIADRLPDGYDRMQLTRTIYLPNLSPGSL